MEIETLAVDGINLAVYNPRKDLQPGDADYEKLKKSILEFDMVEPLVWNKRTGNLVGGHQRLKILKELGIQNPRAIRRRTLGMPLLAISLE